MSERTRLFRNLRRGDVIRVIDGDTGDTGTVTVRAVTERAPGHFSRKRMWTVTITPNDDAPSVWRFRSHIDVYSDERAIVTGRMVTHLFGIPITPSPAIVEKRS